MIKTLLIVFICTAYSLSVSDMLFSFEDNNSEFFSQIETYIKDSDNNLQAPQYLESSPDGKVQTVRYAKYSLPSQIGQYVEYITFYKASKADSYIVMNFSERLGTANITSAHMITEFIITRPEWNGNLRRDTITSIIFMTWWQINVKSYPVLSFLYPCYVSIYKNGNPGPLNPLYFSYFYQENNRPMINHSNSSLPPDIHQYVDKIEFEKSNNSDSQVLIFFSPGVGPADWSISSKIASYIMNTPEWKGDRTQTSVTSEIYLHWVAENIGPFFMSNLILNAIYQDYIIGNYDERISPVEPVHLGYYYIGLNETTVMDSLLKIL